MNEAEQQPVAERVPVPTCEHRNFHTEVAVARISDTGKFRMDSKICCSDCQAPFRFVGAPPGINLPGPCVNIDGTELSVEIEPEGQPRLYSRMNVYMPKRPEAV